MANQHERISYTVWGWRDRRWRAELYLDGYKVAQSFHDTEQQAYSWCDEQRQLLAAVVRG